MQEFIKYQNGHKKHMSVIRLPKKYFGKNWVGSLEVLKRFTQLIVNKPLSFINY